MAGLDELILKVDIQTTGSKSAIKDIEHLEKAFEEAEKGSIEYDKALKDLQTAQRATGKTSSKLASEIDKLEKEQKQLIDTQNKLTKQGKTNSQDFKKNSAQIKSNSNNLSQLRGETNKTGQSFGKFGKSTGSAGASLGKFAKVGGGAVTAIIAIGTALLKAYEYIAPIEKRFNGLSKEIARFAKISGDSLDESTVKVASLADTFGESEKDIIKAVNSLVKNTDGVDTFADGLKLVEQGFLAGANSGEDFLESLQEYPVALKDSRIEGDKLIKILTVGATGGFFTDKLMDSIKEAELSIKELTKTQQDALKPLGADFIKTFKKDIAEGNKSTVDLLFDISAQAQKAGLSVAEMSTITADVLKGAGEDAGGFKNVMDALTEAYSINLDELDEMGKAQKRQLEISEESAKQQQRLAENFKGLSASVSQFTIIAETELLTFFNDFIDMFDSVDDRMSKFKANLNADEVTLNIGKGVTEDFEYGLNSATAEVERTKKALAELKAQGEGGIFSDLDENIENASEQLQKAEATLNVTKQATAEYKNESAKATEILKKLDKQLANEKDANKRAETLKKIESIQGRTIETVKDRKKANQDLTKILGKQTTKVKASDDAIKARKKAIDDQNKALEKWKSLNQSIENQLAESRIAVDKDVFGFDTITAEANLSIAKLNQQFEKDLKTLNQTAKDGRISNSELEASIKSRAEILANEVLVIENEVQQKREQAQLNAVQSYFDQIEQAEKAQDELSDFINEGLESEETDELFLSQEQLNKEISNIKSLSDLYLSEIDLAESEGNKKRREAEKERIEIRRNALSQEIELLKQAGASITEINNKQAELNLLGQDDEKSDTQFFDNFVQGSELAFGVLDQLQEAQNQVLDKQIAKQEERVAKAEKLAENGNTKALERETARLDELEKKKEKAAKRQLALDAAQASAKAVLAIVTAATAPPPLSFATIAGTIAAIASAIPAVTGLFSGAFADGVVNFQGKGTGTSDSNPVLISHGESVITAKGTQNAPNVLKAINKGLLTDNQLLSNPTMLTQPITSVASPDFTVLNDRLGNVERGLKDVVNAIKEQPVSSFNSRITSAGIENITTTQQKKISKLNKRR